MYDAASNRFIVAITTLFMSARRPPTAARTRSTSLSRTPVTRPAHGRSTTCRPRTTAPTERRTTTAPSTARRPGRASRTTRTSAPTRTASTSPPTSTTLFGPALQRGPDLRLLEGAAGRPPGAINVTLVENLEVDGSPGFTVWPAISNAGDYATDKNGTEYFLSTIAGDGSETGNPTGTAQRLGLWALTNTKSLDSATPAPVMSSRRSTARPTCSRRRRTRSRATSRSATVSTTTSALFGPRPGLLVPVLRPAAGLAARGGVEARLG